MSHSVVGKWGKNLAIRVPMEVARAAGLADGEKVEIEAVEGDLIVHRAAARAEKLRDALAAAEEIAAESRLHTLGGAELKSMLEEGRRG